MCVCVCPFHVYTCPCVVILSACLYWSCSVRPLTFHPFYAIVADKKSVERETSVRFKLKVGEEKHYSLSCCLFDKTALLCGGCHMTELTKQTKKHDAFRLPEEFSQNSPHCMSSLKMGFKPLDLPTNLLHMCMSVFLGFFLFFFTSDLEYKKVCKSHLLSDENQYNR